MTPQGKLLVNSSAAGNWKWDRLLQRELLKMFIDSCKHWKLSTVRMLCQLKESKIGMDTGNQWRVMEKVGGGEAREVEVRGASFKLIGRCSCTVIC